MENQLSPLLLGELPLALVWSLFYEGADEQTTKIDLHSPSAGNKLSDLFARIKAQKERDREKAKQKKGPSP